MNQPKPPSLLDWDFPTPNFQNFIQAPLPCCLDTLPILLTIEGQGNGRQDPSPLAPPEPSPNE